jgi:hypothetical protein
MTGALWLYTLAIPAVVGLLDYLISVRLLAVAPKEKRQRGEALRGTLLLILVSAAIGLTWDLRSQTIERLDSPAMDVVKNPRLRPVVQNLLNAHSQSTENEYLNKYFQESVDSFNAEMTGIANRKFWYDPSRSGQFVIDALSNAKTVLATSFVSPNRWWTSDWGKKYQRANLDSAGRGAKIERIFIYASSSELQEVCPLLTEQLEHRIIVKVVDRKKLGDAAPPDLIIIDGSLGGEMVLSDLRTTERVNFYIDQFQIDKLRDAFKTVEDQAEDFHGCKSKAK